MLYNKLLLWFIMVITNKRIKNMTTTEKNKLEKLIDKHVSIGEQIEREFMDNKAYAPGFIFRGVNKYYDAWQVSNVVRYIRKNGFNQYKPQDIKTVVASNPRYYGPRIEINRSIHIATKETQKEFIQWCIGFNDGVTQC